VIATVMAVKAGAAQAESSRPKLIHFETVGQNTITSASFGPVGPNCDANTGGSACAYVNGTFTSSNKTVPFGPSTVTGTFSLLFGVGGTFLTPSGQHDAAGNPIGSCTPASGTSTATYAGGTITFNNQGYDCCASNNPSEDCPVFDPFGPPTINRIESVITGGTGIFAGASGGCTTGGYQATDSAPGPLIHCEGVLLLPDGSSSKASR
jgi:hypothetical protein